MFSVLILHTSLSYYQCKLEEPQVIRLERRHDASRISGQVAGVGA
jgi:hypothetical protein